MFKHLLVPLDGSYLAEAALPAALELASRFDSEITLLRVTRTPYFTTSVSGSAYAELLINLRNQTHQEAVDYLKTHQRALRQQGFKVHTHITEGEPVAEIVLDVADGLDVDTIVMSTHGRGGMSRWVFGSVADRILQQARVPVVLLRAQERVPKNA